MRWLVVILAVVAVARSAPVAEEEVAAGPEEILHGDSETDPDVPLVVDAGPLLVPAEPLEVPAEPLVVPDEPLVVLAEPLVVPAEPLVVPDEPLVVPAEPIEVPAEPLVVPAEPVMVPAEPLVVPAGPIEVPAEPLVVPVPSPPVHLVESPSDHEDAPQEKLSEEWEQLKLDAEVFLIMSMYSDPKDFEQYVKYSHGPPKVLIAHDSEGGGAPPPSDANSSPLVHPAPLAAAVHSPSKAILNAEGNAVFQQFAD